MATHENIRIDYLKVFEILPDIMTMPMKRLGNKWYSPRHMDGSFSTRWDKLVCRLVDDGIQVLEQGGAAVTLFSWMLQFGGCRTPLEAKMKLLNLSAAVIEVPEYIEQEIEQKFVPQDYVNRSYENRIQKPDNFTLFLYETFGKGPAENVLRKYMVGRAWVRMGPTGRYGDVTQFWYIDRNNNACHDKNILYKTDGHRDKDYGGGRAYTKGKGYTGRCFFGEHLLPTRKHGEKVYILESEKSCILADLYFKQGIWLASGGKNCLRGADIKEDWTLIADIDAWPVWHERARHKCPEWWKAYPEWKHGPKDDIGDLVLDYLIKK